MLSYCRSYELSPETTINVGVKCSTHSATNLCPSLCRCFQVHTGLAMMGKFGISASFVVIYVYTAEIFPTVLRRVHLIFTPTRKWFTVYNNLVTFQPLPPRTYRQTGMGAWSMFARIGGILVLIINLLHNQSLAAPQIIFGTSALLAAGLALALPETVNRPLPDRLADAENWDLRY